MVAATLTTEFLIDGEFSFYSAEDVDVDTYSNLFRRQGNVDEQWITRKFSKGKKVETRTIVDHGETTVVRTTLEWK